MSGPGFAKLVRAALPGSINEIIQKSGCVYSTVRRWLVRFCAAGECHIARWQRTAGGFSPVYALGPGRNVPCRLKPRSSSFTSKQWRQRARDSGQLDLVYDRRNAIDRAKTAAKRKNTWFGALPGGV